MGDIMSIDYSVIGTRLKGHRLEAQLTQEKVAEEAGITTVYLSRIENGKVAPTLDTFAAICDAVHADLGVFFSDCQYNQKKYANDTVLELFRECSPEVKPIALRILKELSEIKTQQLHMIAGHSKFNCYTLLFVWMYLYQCKKT